MPELRSPFSGAALQYAVERRRQAQRNSEMIGGGIDRGMARREQRGRDAEAEAYRNAQMEQRQSEFEAEQKHRDEMLRLKKEEMYGGREIDVPMPQPTEWNQGSPIPKEMWDYSQGRPEWNPGSPIPKEMWEAEQASRPEPTTREFVPTVESMKAAADAGRKGRAEERADVRTDLAVGAHNRGVRSDASRAARESWKMAREKFKDRVQDFDPTDVAWLRKNRAAVKRDPTLLDKWGTDEFGTMTPDEMREFYQLLDEAEDAFAVAKSGTALAPAGPTFGPGPDEEEDDEDIDAVLGED